MMRFASCFAALALLLSAAQAAPVHHRPAPKAAPQAVIPPGRNIVIFVADGLRSASVTPETAPTMARIRREGVDFANSHAVYPTLTTANASAIATGHFLGDTGNYANTLYVKFPVECRQGASVTFVEDDCILREVKAHYPGDYIAQTTLLQAAREAGLNTVVIGKKGPAAIQYLAALDSKNDNVEGPLGLFIDDATNRPANLDGTPSKSTMLNGLLGVEVLQSTGMSPAPAFPATPNLVQQAYLRQSVTQVVIPRLKDSGKPFAMLYWSRDPDTTQHGAEDSDGKLVPGINSTSGRAAIYNADSDLKGLLEALKQWGLDGNTDVFVTADHGFSTIARGIPTADGRMDRTRLAPGFVAIDVSNWLGQKIFDPDRNDAELDLSQGEHPAQGSGLIGSSPEAPQAVVVGNGGSDFIYVPDGAEGRDTAKRIFAKLVEQPYVGALFVNDALFDADAAAFAGALKMSDVNLIGSSKVPQPAIVVGFRNFVVNGCKLGPEMCTAEIADTSLHTGQGMHGSFSRADTRNFMAAIGPDFKTKFSDKAPVGNVDIAHTMAHILGLTLDGPGSLKGRVLSEAFKGGKLPKVVKRSLASATAANGVQTRLEMQQVGTTRYFDAAGIPGRTVGLPGR
jgi:predicted AlkP superfamily pyrophosphatase or phosphodiesterase